MSGWMAVDFDGTLAHYTGWRDGELGEPIAPMVERVKNWLALGIEVRILTARVGACGETSEVATDDHLFALSQKALIEQWCVTHIGQVLRVTATKDFQMIELWDDRAIRVRSNEGHPCCDHHLEDNRHGQRSATVALARAAK